MGKVLKKSITALIAAVLVFAGSVQLAAAGTAAPKVEGFDFKGNGKVEIEFVGKVHYKNAKVVVKDANGKSYKAKIVKKDNDDITVKISDFKYNKKYKVTVKGVAKRGSSAYKSVTANVKVPKVGGIRVKEVSYDADDHEVEFDFADDVKYKSLSVKITRDGKNYVRKIKDKDDDEFEVAVKPLQEGKTYTYTISGIRKAGKSETVTITGTFVAWDEE